MSGAQTEVNWNPTRKYLGCEFGVFAGVVEDFTICTVAWLAHNNPKGENISCIWNDEVQRLMWMVIANYCPGCGGQTGILLASLGPEKFDEESSSSYEGTIVRKKPRYERFQ